MFHPMFSYATYLLVVVYRLLLVVDGVYSFHTQLGFYVGASSRFWALRKLAIANARIGARA